MKFKSIAILIVLMIFVSGGCKKSNAPILLKEVGPAKTKAGQAFNVQPDGVSAIWAVSENATPSTVIVWGDRQLKASVFHNPKLLTAVVPKELYAKPGQIQVYLTDTKTGVRSNSVVFDIE